MFTAPDIITLRMAKPFVPFRIELLSGESIPVMIPTAIGTHLKSSFCGVAEENGACHRIPFRSIASIVPLPAENLVETNDQPVCRTADRVFTAHDIVALRMAQPFVPFRIELLSGESVSVLFPTGIGTHLKSRNARRWK